MKDELPYQVYIQKAIEKFGDIRNSPLTLEEIGEVMGITRERVRQIEISALKKLRHPKLGSKIRQYAFYDNASEMEIIHSLKKLRKERDELLSSAQNSSADSSVS